MKVLVVDDDVVSRMVLMHLVDSSGSYDIVEADDGPTPGSSWKPACARRVLSATCACRACPAWTCWRGCAPTAPTTPCRSSWSPPAPTPAPSARPRGLGVSGYIVKPFQAGQVRVHLASLSGPPDGWVHRAEPPAATMARLGIDYERLLAYLGGFQGQLAGGQRRDRRDAGARRNRTPRASASRACTPAASRSAWTAPPRASTRWRRAARTATRVHLALADAIRSVIAQADGAGARNRDH